MKDNTVCFPNLSSGDFKMTNKTEIQFKQVELREESDLPEYSAG